MACPSGLGAGLQSRSGRFDSDCHLVTRDDLRDMSAYDGEHSPYEVDVTVAEHDDTGAVIAVYSERQLRCGCTDSLEHDWPHS